MADPRDTSGQDEPSDARSASVKVVKRLVDAGHVAYFAGGCVRDQIMGIEPVDFDVATDARPEEVARLFRGAQGVGESFGVMLVRSLGHSIQVATFRSDGAYSDGRHPDQVIFCDAQHDAQRRDFTMNGLFENPLTGEVIDYVGGRDDIKAKLIRAIGDPAARLSEDRLRMLRAVRFAARFGFDIEPATAESIRQGASHLDGVSRERIGQEIRKMLVDRNRAVSAWQLQYLGLDAVVLMEPNVLLAPSRLGRLPDEVFFPTALAAWLLDRYPDASSAVGGGRAGGAGDAGVAGGAGGAGAGSGGAVGMRLDEPAARWAEALKLSNAEQAAMVRCLDVYATLLTGWPSLGVARQKRLAGLDGFDQGLLLLQCVDRQGFVDVRRRVASLAESGLNPDPFIDGEDLIQLGYQPGPVFKRVLDAVYDAQLEGTVEDREDALGLAVVLIQSESAG